MWCSVGSSSESELYCCGGTGTGGSSVWGTGRMADEILGQLTVLFFLCNSVSKWWNYKNGNVPNDPLVPYISWEGQKSLNALCYLAIHTQLQHNRYNIHREPIFVWASDIATGIAFISFSAIGVSGRFHVENVTSPQISQKLCGLLTQFRGIV